MEKLLEDSLTVQKYLPWIDNNEDIINFMGSVPVHYSYLRTQLAMKFFLRVKDNNPILIQEIEDDAHEIVSILPNCPFLEIKKLLKEMGNINNRKEVVIRKLLSDREDLKTILAEMNNLSESRKRAPFLENDQFANSKIRRLHNSENITPEVFQENVTTKIDNNLNLQENSKLVTTKWNIIQPARFVINHDYDATNISEVKPISNPNVVEEIAENEPVQVSAGPTCSKLPKPVLPIHLPKPPETESDAGVLIDLVNNDDGVDEAIPLKKSRKYDDKLVLRLIEIFPETCPEYIRDICNHKQWHDFDDLVSIILENENHPKRQRRSPSPPNEIDPEEQFEMVTALLPDADPTYLRMQCDKLEYNPQELNKFIVQARENKGYPTMKEYLRKQQLSAQSKQYTTEFSIKKFIELFPEPHITFNDPKRVIEMDNYSKLYVKQYFENKFDKLPKKIIHQTLNSNFGIIKTDRKLTKVKDTMKMKSRRKHVSMDNNLNNILLLQELAYLENKNEIENFLKLKQEKEEEERQYAKDNGLMNTCQCCFDEEIMPKDTFYCPKKCLFCRNCIKKSCEIGFGEGQINFKCLNDCPEEFNLQLLQGILMPKMFSKIAQKKTLAEIKAAGIEDLEMCPFCDFASIPSEHDKIFKCLNEECMKESCRICKEPNHIPLHCDEIEKDENVKARVFIENKMTEALLCKCWKCGTSYFKEEGCNKMTCTCGAQMCYICKKPVKDYTHFNGIGGDKFHLCPLYTDNNKLNQQKVMSAVLEAKAQIDPFKLKVDPTDKLQEHYVKRGQKLPREPHQDLLIALERRRQQLNGLL